MKTVSISVSTDVVAAIQFVREFRGPDRVRDVVKEWMANEIAGSVINADNETAQVKAMREHMDKYRGSTMDYARQYAGKLEMIKEYRTRYSAGLLEAKQFIEKHNLFIA